MDAAVQRPEFQPPAEPGRTQALALAVAAHLVLAAALTWGVSWRNDPKTLSAEAELWSATVQQAAPRPAETPPPPPPSPAPVARPVPPPPAPALRDADIALQRQKLREAEERKQLEAAKAEALKKQQAEKKRLEEQQKREQAAKAAREKAAQQEAQERAQEQAEARRVEAQRQENLRRMQGLAGATGATTATGTAQRSSGPSDSYAGRIRARVKPNIVFTDDVPGNPVTEVEVRMAADGTIISRRITKSSGLKAWDDAVLRALDRTEVLPRDTDGRVHSPLLMEFRPKG